MPSDALVTFQFAGLAAEYCYTTAAQLARDIASGLTGYLPGQFTVVINSQSEPEAIDQGKLWHKLLPGDVPSGKIYTFYGGEWVSPNPVEPSAIERRWVEATPAEIWAYDGGDGTDPALSPPTASTGAMWQEDLNYATRFPMGAGTSPAPNNTVFAVGATGGEEKHTLLAAELPKHKHFLFNNFDSSSGNPPTNSSSVDRASTEPGGNREYAVIGRDAVASPATVGLSSEVGSDTPLNNLPPYRVGRMIMRTGRIFYKA